MEIRLAESRDAMAVAGVHVRSWQAAYRGLLPTGYLDQLRAQDRAEHYDFAHLDLLKPQTMVAIEEGRVLGFATTAPSRDPDLADHGELLALYVDPKEWGRGVGSALMSAASTRLVECGFRKALLWVLVGNLQADRFYRKYHWAPDGHHRTDTLWDVTVDEARYRSTLHEP
jgi:GNAT superfamily N-acetyltransferase